MRTTLTMLLCFFNMFAFGTGVAPYAWLPDRKPYVLSEKEKVYTEYLLKFHRQYDLVWENGHLMWYSTEHRITRVTNAESIQRHNRIYISMNDVVELVDLKARSITKDGKILVFDKNNLKEVKDEKSDNTYKIFAMEGVESDSELEYFYTLKIKGRVNGMSYLQFEMPVKEASLLLICPGKLEFDFRLYHDSSKVTLDTLNGMNRYSLTMVDIPGLAKEKFSYFDANRKRVEIKLAYNTATSNARLNTWADAAKGFYKTLVDIDKDAEIALDKFVATLVDNKSMTMSARIRNVEDKIKNQIEVSQSSEFAHESLSEVLKFRQASSQGITRLMLLSYLQLDIPVQVVVTSNRESSKFDATFDTWNFLEEYLLFFPETGGFLSPNANDLRYPLITEKYTATKGLFIEPIAIGSAKSAIGLIRDIPAPPASSNTDNLDITVQFDEELETNTIFQKRTFTGYEASYLVHNYDGLTAEEKNKFIDELFRSDVPDVTLVKWSVSVTEIAQLPRFEIDATFRTNHFIEGGGPKVLFKAGELIGPQTELYRDDNRMSDVENPLNRGYDRIISIAIPKGYKITNTDALNFNVFYVDGNRVPFQFVTTYTQENDMLKITINEFYKDIYAPRSRYEDFRKVVNASADFNKVTLILQKK